MCIKTETTIEKIKIPTNTLELWNGQEYVFYNFCGKFTSADFCFRLEFSIMTSDGLSIPKRFRNRIERMGRRLVGGLYHDAFYCGEIIPRDEADWIFLQILEFKDTFDREYNPKQAPSRWWGWTIRNAAWLAVKAGGYFVWKKHDPIGLDSFRENVKLTITECPQNLREKIYKHEQKMFKKEYPPVIFFEC